MNETTNQEFNQVEKSEEILKIRQSALVRQLVEAGQSVGHPHTCKLRAIGQSKYTEHLRIYANQSLTLYREALFQVKNKLDAICTLLGVEIPKTEQDLRRIAKFCALMIESRHIPQTWVFSPHFSELITDLQQMVDERQKMNDLLRQLSEKWSSEITELDGILFWEEWEKAHTKGFLKKHHHENMMMQRLRSYAKVAVDKNDLAECLKNLSECQKREAAIAAISSRYHYELFGLYYNKNSDFTDIKKFLSRIKRMDLELKSMDGYSMLERITPDSIPQLQMFFGTWRTFSEVQDSVYRLFAVDESKLEPCPYYIDLDIHMCDMWQSEIHLLKNWVLYQSIVQKACEMGLENIVALYEEGLPHDEVLPTFENMGKKVSVTTEKTSSEKEEIKSEKDITHADETNNDDKEKIPTDEKSEEKPNLQNDS